MRLPRGCLAQVTTPPLAQQPRMVCSLWRGAWGGGQSCGLAALLSVDWNAFLLQALSRAMLQQTLRQLRARRARPQTVCGDHRTAPLHCTPMSTCRPRRIVRSPAAVAAAKRTRPPDCSACRATHTTHLAASAAPPGTASPACHTDTGPDSCNVVLRTTCRLHRVCSRVLSASRHHLHTRA